MVYYKRYYNKLLELNLEEIVKAGDLIDKLRALTHAGFNNAYFVDPESGKKVYVDIRLRFEQN